MKTKLRRLRAIYRFAEGVSPETYPAGVYVLRHLFEGKLYDLNGIGGHRVVEASARLLERALHRNQMLRIRDCVGFRGILSRKCLHDSTRCNFGYTVELQRHRLRN